MQGVKEKALELLASGKAQRVLGWKTGEFFYDLTPAVFESAEAVEQDFQFGAFAGANLSKYCIAESKKDGVILCGCHPGDCHYTTGNYYARRRMTLLFSMLDFLGVEKERTRVEWVSAAEGAKFAATMNEFVETITKLGENRRLEDLRCKE